MATFVIVLVIVAAIMSATIVGFMIREARSNTVATERARIIRDLLIAKQRHTALTYRAIRQMQDIAARRSR